ncbi:MAG: rhomboid family intramembrane serine protease [Dehalococcoidia bacterium]|nr:rhomboid family intramembrane serine protease [Dehalococcoidia bacterium]
MFPIRDLNPTRVFPYVTLLLIAANALVYFFWQPHGGPQEAQFLYRHAAIACEVTTGQPLTVEEYQLDVCRQNAPGEAIFPNKAVTLSLFVSMFLHGSLFHLLGNMWFLWLFGNNIEEAYGPLRFLLVYLFSGLIAAVGFIALNPDSITPFIGASGAIAGVLGAYLILFPGRWVISLVVITLLPIPAAVFLGLWFVMQFLVGDPGVAWEAHVIGFLAGAAITVLFRGPLLRRIERIHRRLPPVWS